MGHPFWADGCSLKDDLWFPTLSAEKSGKDGARNFFVD